MVILLPNMPFKGIPDQKQMDIYRNIYFQAVEKTTYEIYGKEATTADTVKSMNLYGNWWFLESFKDVYNSKEVLGHLYQESFRVVNHNLFADFIHGLNHIRAKGEHDPGGELLLLADQYYTVNTSYADLGKMNAGKPLSEINNAPKNDHKFSFENWKQDTLATFREYIRAWDEYFVSSQAKHERIGTSKVKVDFFTPSNQFEAKLAESFIRAIFMDEKFKYYGSTQLSFIDTSVKTSSIEQASIVFSTKEEDNWVKRIHDRVLHEGAKGIGQIIKNSPNGSHADKVAVQAAKQFSNYLS